MRGVAQQQQQQPGRAPSSNGRVQGTKGLGGGNGPSRRRTTDGATRPLVTKARNRRSALGGPWEHRVTLSSDLGGPRRRRQRQTGTPRQALQSHLAAAAGLDMGHGLRRVAWMPSQCSPMLLSPSLAGSPVGQCVRRRPAPGIQGLVFFPTTSRSSVEGGPIVRASCVCVCMCVCQCARVVCVCVCRAQDGHLLHDPSTPVLAPPT